MAVQAVLVASLVADQFVAGAQSMMRSASGIVTALTEAYNSVQKMQNTLITSSGSYQAAANDLLRLRETTDRLGISLEAAATPFAKFAAAADDLSKDDTFSVFEGFSTALAATHAGAQQVSGTFLALQQILSKGKVNMQDLRRQLAEHIPGAMEYARQAFGDGTASMEEFEKAVSDGMVDASTWIVKFAELMEENFGPAAARAAASLENEMNRVSTAWLMFQANVVDSSGITDVMIEGMESLRTNLFDNKELMIQLSAALNASGEAAGKLIEHIPAIVSGMAQIAEWTARGVTNLTEFAEAAASFGSDLATNLGKTVEDLGVGMGVMEEGANKMAAAIEYATEVSFNAGEDHKQMNAEITSSEEKKHAAFMAMVEKEKEAYEANVELVKKASEDRYDALKDMYEKTGKLSEGYLIEEKIRLTAVAEEWSRWMTEAERLEWVNAELQKLVDGSGEAKEAAKASADEAERMKEQEAQAAKEATKMAAEQKKVAEESKIAAAAAAKLAAEERKAATAAEDAAKAKDRINTENRIVDRDAESTGSSGGGFSGSTSAHGDSLTDAEWQALPQYMKDFMGKSVAEGSSSYDYFNAGTGQRFSGEQGFTQDWARTVAQGASGAASAAGGSQAVVNNFHSTISRSDITGIIEEQLRVAQRT